MTYPGDMDWCDDHLDWVQETRARLTQQVHIGKPQRNILDGKAEGN